MGLATEGRRVLNDEGLISLSVTGTGFIIRRSKERIYGIGSGRVCPVCGFSGRKFAPAGNPPRREAQCPRCGARERHRLLWYYLENETRLTDGGREILYFAPTNSIAENLRERGNRVVGVDLRSGNVDAYADITRLPFPDNAFDTIICSHVLEHIPDDRAAMAELYRVLNSEGEAFVMVPKDKHRERNYEDDSVDSPEARLREFGQENHVRLYGRQFVRRLNNSGFDVSVDTYAERLSGETVDKYGLKVHDRDAYFGPAIDAEPDQIKYEDVHRLTT